MGRRGGGIFQICSFCLSYSSFLHLLVLSLLFFFSFCCCCCCLLCVLNFVPFFVFQFLFCARFFPSCSLFFFVLVTVHCFFFFQSCSLFVSVLLTSFFLFSFFPDHILTLLCSTSHRNRHLKDSLPPPPPPPPPPPLSPTAAPFTEMSIAPNKPLPPPPPTQPLATILTAFPAHKARASSGPKTTVGSPDRGSVAERQNSAEEGKTNHDSDKSLVNGFGGRSSHVGSSSSKTSVERQVSQDRPEDGKSKVGAHVGKSGGPAQKKTGSGSSVSEKIRQLQSSLPPPPPLPSDSRPAKIPAHKSSSTELPLPPPPPLSMTDAQKLKSSPPPRPPPPKTMPLPPPPPPLVVTPLPPVDIGKKNEEAKTNGKILLKRLSRPTGGTKEEEAHGEESGDGETSESISTPDTVIANG